MVFLKHHNTKLKMDRLLLNHFTYKHLKKRNNKLKIIVVTAHLEEPLDEFVKRGTIDSYLLKPISAIELSRCIRGLVGDR